jgi:hypothetical protein
MPENKVQQSGIVSIAKTRAEPSIGLLPGEVNSKKDAAPAAVPCFMTIVTVRKRFQPF